MLTEVKNIKIGILHVYKLRKFNKKTYKHITVNDPLAARLKCFGQNGNIF